MRPPILVALLSATMALAQEQQGAALRLPALFADHMVLQQESDVPVWGWAEPLATVEVQAPWLAAPVRAAVAADGRFELRLRTPRADGEPFGLRLQCGDARVELDDVLLGEVWVCSGQSNMAWELHKSVTNPDEEIAAAQCDGLRLFTVQRRVGVAPVVDCEGAWARCTPDTARDFSGVGYFFGRRLQRELGVPVGLICSAWGGTVAEAWMSPRGLGGFGEFTDAVARVDRERRDPTSLAEDARANQNTPTALFHGMIAPLVPFAIRGFCWYQGESNRTRAQQYEGLFRALIRDWRRQWGADLPFYFVQIAPYGYQRDSGEAALLRRAQGAALSLPHTGMVVTMDIGDPKDIHPRQKKAVGERLAALALHDTYGRRDLPCEGPRFSGLEPLPGALRIGFAFAKGLRTRDGGVPSCFEVAGADGVFHPAAAVLDGESVVVRTAEVPEPVMVRYAWSAAAETNLENGDGLPAVPFGAQR